MFKIIWVQENEEDEKSFSYYYYDGTGPGGWYKEGKRIGDIDDSELEVVKP